MGRRQKSLKVKGTLSNSLKTTGTNKESWKCDKIHDQYTKSILFLYTSNEQFQNEIKEIVSLIKAMNE